MKLKKAVRFVGFFRVGQKSYMISNICHSSRKGKNDSKANSDICGAAATTTNTRDKAFSSSVSKVKLLSQFKWARLPPRPLSAGPPIRVMEGCRVGLPTRVEEAGCLPRLWRRYGHLHGSGGQNIEQKIINLKV